MTWVRLDDQFADHPKVVGLSAVAFRLHVRAICYAARHETDGVIPAAFVIKRAATELVGAGLWEENPAGYIIHDYLEYNPSAASLRAKRAAESERKRRGIRPDVNDPVPGPDPVPDPVPPRRVAPQPPADAGGHSPAALRALEGSKRKRDIAAAKAELTLEERYLGRRS